MKFILPVITAGALLAACTTDTAQTDETATAAVEIAKEAGLCLASGPQTPRDISNVTGLNTVKFPMAPASTAMNLCMQYPHAHKCRA